MKDTGIQMELIYVHQTFNKNINKKIKNNSKVIKNKVHDNGDVEVMTNDASGQYKVCVDLKASGNAKGGNFINLKGLRELVESYESSGEDKVVGFVYDGTDNLEVLVQNIDDAAKLTKTMDISNSVDQIPKPRNG